MQGDEDAVLQILEEALQSSPVKLTAAKVTLSSLSHTN